MKRTSSLLTLAISLLLCGAWSSSAMAQCVFSFHPRGPVLIRKATTTSIVRRDIGSVSDDPTPEAVSITGLWDLRFISDGQIVDEGFDQYHSDGTEILNDTPPPAAGNVCLGVWAKTGARTLKLKHPSWIYDPSNTFVIGTATIIELVTLDHAGNSFGGTFTVQLRDLSGNSLGPDLTGELQADRITPD